MADNIDLTNLVFWEPPIVSVVKDIDEKGRAEILIRFLFDSQYLRTNGFYFCKGDGVYYRQARFIIDYGIDCQIKGSKVFNSTELFVRYSSLPTNIYYQQFITDDVIKVEDIRELALLNPIAVLEI